MSITLITSYAPGAGKTHFACSLLRHEAKSGRDAVIGYLSRQRADLIEYASGFENLRPDSGIKITHNQMIFDSKAVIRRAPDAALIDEMALFNPFEDRPAYMGISDVSDAGIAVITTANLHKFDEVNDLVGKATHMRQKTVIPAYLLKNAHVVFLDSEPELVYERYINGGLFTPKQMEREFLNRFMSLSALKKRRAVCLDYLSGLKNVTFIGGQK